MMTDFTTLHTALTSFIEQQDRYNEAYGLFPDTYIRSYPQRTDYEVDERILLSPELEYLYSHYEMLDEKAAGTLKLKSAPVLIGDGILLSFAAPEHLYRQQLGYRWIGDPASPQESADWPPHHVVIAVYNDDPIIVDTSQPGSPVYAAFEGGDPEPIAASLADFFTTLAIMIEGAFDWQGEIMDEETEEVKAGYIESIQPRLQELLGETFMHHLLVYLSLRW